MAPAPAFVLFEPNGDPARITPTASLGPWAMAPLRRVLQAADRDRPVLLDLTRAPLGSPQEVAAVLWADDVAADAGLELEVLAEDVVAAELLDFVGLRAPVYCPFTASPSRGGQPAPARPGRRASAR